jgi:hypothetical protein
MKKLFHALSVFSVLALVACASTETTDTSAAPPLAEDPFLAGESPAPASTDSASAANSAASSSTDTLATPVEGESSSSSSATSSSGSTDGFLAEPTPPGPPPPPPTSGSDSASALPAAGDSAAAAPIPPPVMQKSGAVDDRTLYQQYLEYQDKRKQREDLDDSLETRSLFPHEDGAFQFGLDYAHDAFRGFDFDPGSTRLLADTMGAQLSFTYFPLRSLMYGRLGAGLHGGAYWSKFSYINSTTNQSDTTRKHTIDVFGGKVQYEFQYFVGQILVPFVNYGYEAGRVGTLGIPVGPGTFAKQSFNSKNYGGGVHLNLNRLERRAASRALASSGIRKFYLTYTYQKKEIMEEADHFLGFRFEY